MKLTIFLERRTPALNLHRPSSPLFESHLESHNVKSVRNANEGPSAGCRSPDTIELFAPGLALIELFTT